MLDVSIVIPLYNEERRLKKNLPTIDIFLKKNQKKKVELIFVSDGSSDNTNKIIKDYINENSKKLKINFIKYKKNIGKGFAVKSGVLAAKNKWILICDADLSVHPNQFISWKKNNFLVPKNNAFFGSREHKKSKIKASKMRVILGYFFKKLIRFIFSINLKDTQCGFKVFNKHYSKKVFKDIKSYRFAFDVELTLLLKKNNVKIIELPLKWTHKEGSKLNLFRDMPLMLLDLIIIKFKEKIR
tara:strand:+ start:88 stop:813 length:726 start_codon:yes stop_codon:yes gene_type:complete